MHNFFLKLYYFFRRQKAIGFLLLLLFVLGGGYFASKIQLEEDITKLIPSGEKQDVLRKVLNNTEFSDKLIIAVSSEEKNPKKLTEYASQLIDSLNKELPQYITKIQGEIPDEGILEVYDFVYQNLPLFLNARDYEEINSRLQEDSIQERLESSYRDLISPTGFVTKQFLFKDPLSITNLGLQKLQELQVDDNFKIYNNYLLTKDEQHLLLFITPEYPASETKNNEVFIERLDEIISELNENSEVNAEYFGGVLFAIANAKQVKRDIQLTLSIAFSILLVLLILFYRRIYVPLLLFLPSLLGALTAITLLYFFKGSVSAISLGIGAILLGISLDYALHILTHFRNNADVKTLYQEVSKPILMSSFTTAIAFLCLLFLESEALKDLGIFAAVSVVTASVFALILIPQFYNPPKNKEKEKSNWVDKLAAQRFYQNKFLVGFVLLLFLGGLFFFTKVGFSEDISKLNYEPESIKKAEENIKRISGDAANTTYLVSYGKDIDEALSRNNELYLDLRTLKEDGQVKSFSSIGGVVLSTDKQTERIEAWEEFWSDSKKENLKNNLLRESAELGFKAASFNQFYEQLNKNFNGIFLDDYRDVSTLYLDDFINRSPGFSTVTSTLSFDKTNSEVLQELQEEEGIIAIDRKQMNQDLLGDLKSEFNQLILFSLIAVFIVLLLFYRNLLLSVLTLLPIAITWIITLGIMAVLNIEFNILNIIISTFIFGLGLDYSIFITNACLKEYETGKPALKTYQASILLSVLTTLLGIGALVFAKHPALQAVSVVSVIGVLTAVLVAFVIQTKIFDLLFFRRKVAQKAPFSFSALVIKSKNKEQLYLKNAVLGNYRYKSVFSKAKKEFSQNRERFLKVSGFIDSDEKIFMLNSNFGILPIFLSMKNPENEFFVLDTHKENRNIANNTPQSNAENLKINKEWPEDFKDYLVFIISEKPSEEITPVLKENISRYAEKVIILTSEYENRWLIDLNFEIIYRQNNILVLKRMD
ncbi:MMPL family transporter [Salegentibacter sp. JZCK2]|uniref:MMPL family transporter n=1 Tax=Salegentibacter tibetensis TaxID=2873600 RepID=UPI001CCC847D|nr:MMPL family transporter [Salegentibacter tibetensis]MBZ9729635.1 MMPL family transporter [Salegentibacter tibetensis]